MRKVLYSALYDDGYPFNELVEKVVPIINPDKMVEPDAYLVIWGGGDISPFYYGEKPNRFCGADEFPSKRDEVEAALIDKALSMGIGIIGVCRGAQFVCAKLGGKLVQHVANHTTTHHLVTKEGSIMVTSSLHHQLMVPAGDYDILAVPYDIVAEKAGPRSVGNGGERIYIGENNASLDIAVEPEVVLWPKQKVLGIQGHPEYMQLTTPFVQWCLKLVEQHL